MAPEVPRPVTAYVGVGSNVKPEENIPKGLELLAREARLCAVSTFYRCAALDRPEQPEFVNGVCRVETDRPARDFKFGVLRDIERRLGRHRTADRYAPRTLDLDLLLYGDRVWSEDDLVVPDPDIRTRPFIAVPLLELAPDLTLPDTLEPLADVAAAHDRKGLRPDRALTEAIRLGMDDESRAR